MTRCVRLLSIVALQCMALYGHGALDFLSGAINGPCSGRSCGTLEGLQNCVMATANYKERSTQPRQSSRQNYSHAPYGYGNNYYQMSYGYGAPSYYPREYIRPRRQQTIYHPSPAAQQRAHQRHLFLNLLDPHFVENHRAEAEDLLTQFIMGSNRCRPPKTCSNKECYKYFCRNVCSEKRGKYSNKNSIAQLCSTDSPDGTQMKFLCGRCGPFLGEGYTLIRACQSERIRPPTGPNAHAYKDGNTYTDERPAWHQGGGYPEAARRSSSQSYHREAERYDFGDGDNYSQRPVPRRAQRSSSWSDDALHDSEDDEEDEESYRPRRGGRPPSSRNHSREGWDDSDEDRSRPKKAKRRPSARSFSDDDSDDESPENYEDHFRFDLHHHLKDAPGDD